MIHVNFRSILGVFVDVESLGVTRLCKSHLKASLSTLLLNYCFFKAIFSLWKWSSVDITFTQNG